MAETNQIRANLAFTKQSAVFDELYTNDPGIIYKRDRVRKHVLQFLKPSSKILELNCGTGEDVIFFASEGNRILATDISEGMLDRLKSKITDNGNERNITTAQCSFTTLDRLPSFEPDHIFSNFGGLNCTRELAVSLQQMDALLKPGGRITLVIISTFCLWETLLLFKGKFKTAFRRFNSNKGRIANVEGTNFKCWYYNSAFVKKHLSNYTVLAEEGLCTFVPPSYMEHFATKHPKLYRFLERQENKLKDKRPWKNIGDYFIITLQKN